jgi:hypothetical protein
LTEAQWLEAEHPWPLLSHLQGVRKALATVRGRRKSAAYVAAVCRRVLPFIDRPAAAQPARDVIAVLEARAAGRPDEARERAVALAWWQAGVCGFSRAFPASDPLGEADCRHLLTCDGIFRRNNDNEDVLGTHGLDIGDRRRIHLGCQAVQALLNSFARDHYRYFDGHVQAALAVGGVAARAELAAQCAIVRDVFGNPFRKPTFDRRWRTGTAVALARRTDQSRDASALPILADALQDAGCARADILDHCRGPGPHVLGCWVVDLVLDRQ